MITENDFMSTLKWSELAQIEEYLGVPMDEWSNIPSKSKLAFVMQFMLAKRNNISLTIDQAETMTIKELSELAGVELLPKEVTTA